eukprot:3007080-Pyramimonas_sp.AAC.1
MCCSKRYVNAATPRVVLINATISGHLLWSRVCAYLERVDEGHPCEVPEGEHVAEAVGGDVHGRQNGLFVVHGV